MKVANVFIKSKTSPYEILKKRQPNVSYLLTWGCLANVIISDRKRVKLTSRVYECIFNGYALKSKVHRFYDDDFYQKRFPFKTRNNGGTKTSQVNVIKSTKSNNKGEIEP